MGGSVLKSSVKAMVIVAGMAWAGMACAVGFGNASVNSALGQPLKVQIALTTVSAQDRAGMSARLASPEAFKAAGLDYPYSLSSLKFDIVVRKGQTYIEVTSRESVNDSFINLLIELDWPSGRLVREYTFLLDPPDYKAEKPQVEEVAPIEPVVTKPLPPEQPEITPLPQATAAATQPAAASQPAATAQPAATTQPAEVAASTPQATPQPGIQEIQAEPGPASTVQQAPTETAAAQPNVAPSKPAARTGERETITVKRGDTLSKIAAQVREPDVTLEQMLVALYRANVGKFDGKNMNRIRAGKILTIPEPEEYEHLTQAAAVKEIRIQTANWNAYRQKLAAGPTASEQAPKQGTSGKVTTSVVDQAPVTKGTSKEVLKLSTGEKPGDKTVPGGKQPKEDAIARDKQAAETEKRIALQEKMNQETKAVIEMKGGVPVPASPVVSTVPTPAASQAAASQVKGGPMAGSGVQGKPKLPQPAHAEEKSFIDDILDNPMIKDIDPLYLGGGAAGLIALVGGGVYFVRRRRAEAGGGRKKKRLGSKD